MRFAAQRSRKSPDPYFFRSSSASVSLMPNGAVLLVCLQPKFGSGTGILCERAVNFTKAIAAEQVESELVWCLVRCRRISRFAVGFNRLYLRRITTPRKAPPSDRHLFVFV